MTDKDKIRAEIERRRALNFKRKQGSRSLEDNDILSFIDSMQEDPVSEDERIRKWLIKYFKNINDEVAYEDREKIIAWLEKQCEQKPTDKVEPKFHEGDWVVNTITKEVEQVIELTGCEYICSGHLIVSFNNQDLLKGWDMEDAKDGDVLYTPKGAGVEGIFLIKGWKQVECTGKTLCSSIGYRVEEDEIVVGGLGAIWWEGVVDPFYPATKEQLELLFQKMHEAGYEWDAEKKELKKIEIKPEWSEKDKCMLNNVIDTLKPLSQFTHSSYSINSMVNWLKSLKDRYTWKPSKEQMYWLKNAIDSLDTISVRSSRQNLESLYNDLKKLKS